MISGKKKYFKLTLILLSLIILTLLLINFLNILKKGKDAAKAAEPITLNLLTNVHPNLSWSFKPLKPKIFVIPGKIITIDYMVENLGNKVSTGIATFAYYPNNFGVYISKLNCFCYDARSLQPNQKDKYSVIILIDPEVTKNSKTKNIKEVTIQFTFFDYKEYKGSES